MLNKGNQEDINMVLSLLFNSLCTALRGRTGYALKGGYIMTNFITHNSRKTSDIDLSIDSQETFWYIINAVKPVVEELKAKGDIYDYKIKEPKVTETRNMSGNIKIFVKPSANESKRILCGIDISMHNLSFGIKLVDGLSMFSIERMLADKIDVLYSDFRTIKRRIRDLYDIYLFNYNNCCVDMKELEKCFRYRHIHIQQLAVFELLNAQERFEILSALDEYLNDGKETIELLQRVNITSKDIVKSTLDTLEFIRKDIKY